ncbi:DUF188 domain-containing protein [Borrelia coriaceae]|uniref:Cytosolic protein n=1 Tax=Borrelia coriaceae ATCC 43381 TaxID=1408429 RepID=W5SU09_9SPIR|nr:DUF188 domain-containing protein [Borrelia coriaceae]AHH10183.1 Putative cytosolic protein [Borrelia coriaceae ATCC 43381]UPA15910.1 DUF188 domain-containing protein [Borrelia coriaceae]
MLNKIFVDADSCNLRVVKFLQNFVSNRNVELILVANRHLNLKILNNTSVKIARDVDSLILRLIDRNSMVITRDISFVKNLLNLKVKVMNDEGQVFDTNNINYLYFRSKLNINLGIKVKKYFREDANQKKYSNFAMNFHSLFFN